MTISHLRSFPLSHPPSPADAGAVLADVLRAAGPAPELGDAADVYGWLVGSWRARIFDHDADGTVHESEGESHFAWVLAGRAMQDVWISPLPDARHARHGTPRVRYGTTLRVFDPSIGAWRVTWINPVSGAENHLVGRRVGGDVVQEGHLPDGTAIRWTFTDIAEASFTWRGESSVDGGVTWRLHTVYRCTRVALATRSAAVRATGVGSTDR